MFTEIVRISNIKVEISGGPRDFGKKGGGGGFERSQGNFCKDFRVIQGYSAMNFYEFNFKGDWPPDPLFDPHWER